MKDTDINEVAYATQFGAKVTDFYEIYFGLEYPLPKMGELIQFYLFYCSI